MASKAATQSLHKLSSAVGLSAFDEHSVPEVSWAQALLDSVTIPFLYVDTQQIVRTVNVAACKLFSRKPGSLVGKHINDVVIPTREPGGDAYDLAGAVIRTFSESGSRELGPFLLKKRVGKTGPVSVTIEPHGQNGSDDAGCAVMIRSVSPEETGQKLRDSILSLVSHELRTPLLHIKGFVSSLLQTDVEWDEETRIDFLRTIDHEADRLTTLVEDLLDISALQGGLLPLTLEKSDPYLLVHQGIDEASPYIGQHRIMVDVAEDLPTVKIDQTRVVTVLVNLLQNATRHSKPGTLVQISAKTVGQMVQISVEDEGPGIPVDQRQDIFDPFYRGKNHSKKRDDKTAGTGLGLAVTRASIGAHGGQIWVDNAEGTGAKFSFTVPCS